MVDRALTITRLEQVIGAAERAPLESFDMTVWWEPAKASGCAIGWAIQQPEIAAQGLTLQKTKLGLQVVCGKQTSYNAVAQFLGIPKRDAYRLFTPGFPSSRQKREVLQTLETYLERRKARQRQIATFRSWLIRQTPNPLKHCRAHCMALAKRLPAII